MIRKIYILSILFVALVFVSCSKDGSDIEGSGVEPVPPKVKVVRVAGRVGVQNKIKVAGHIEPNVEALLISEVDARVSVLHVGLSENVRKGELLVELDLIPPAIGAARHVISPISGRVVELFMETGERINAGDELLRVKNMSSVRVILNLRGMHYEDIREGQGVRISVPGLSGLRFIGSIFSIADEVDEESGLFEVQVMVRNPQGKLKAGLKANASIDTGITKEVHVLPVSALATMEGRDIVYVVVDDHAIEREVVVVRRTDEIIQVLLGLTMGDTVVIESDKGLTNDAKVIIID